MHDGFRDLEQENRIPRFFLVFFFALIAWGLYYIVAYTPEFSGWSQYKVLGRQLEAEKAASPAVVPHENPYEKDSNAIAEG